MSENLFFVVSRHGNVGTNVMFHVIDGKGYTTDIDNCHLFSLDEAKKELSNSMKSIPLLAEDVKKHSILAVDMQYLDSDKAREFESDLFCVQINDTYNGNDIGFVIADGKDDIYNYSFADTFTKEEAEALVSSRNVSMWSKIYLDTLARRTFQEHNIDIEKMTVSQGIPYKIPRKKSK